VRFTERNQSVSGSVLFIACTIMQQLTEEI